MLRDKTGVFAVVIISVVLAFAAGSASADVEVSATRIRATAAALTFGNSEFSEISIVCEVTLEMTLRSERIPIVERTTAGDVTSARTNERCRGGTVTFLTLPWPVKLVSFSEGLIRLQLEGVAVLVADSGGLARCLYRGSSQFTNVNDAITSFRFDERVTIPLSTRLGGIFCPRSGFIQGEVRVSPQIIYTESATRGKPLQPQAARISFRRMVGVQETVEFRNTNWIWDVNVSSSGILGASRFREIDNGAEECVRRRRIERVCKDRIELNRAGAEGAKQYLVLDGEKVMGSVELFE